MYADLGPGLEADIGPPSPDGASIFYSHDYVARRMREPTRLHATYSFAVVPGLSLGQDVAGPSPDANLFQYANARPTTLTDPTGLAARVVGEVRIQVLDPETGGSVKCTTLPHSRELGKDFSFSVTHTDQRDCCEAVGGPGKQTYRRTDAYTYSGHVLLSFDCVNGIVFIKYVGADKVTLAKGTGSWGPCVPYKEQPRTVIG